MIVGIDIGGTKALAVLVDPASNLVEASVVAPSSGSAFELVESIVDLITYLDDQTTAPIDISNNNNLNTIQNLHSNKRLQC